jgi:hypothetical protein
MTSLGALFLALLPVGLLHAIPSPELTWRLASAAMGIYLVIMTAVLLRMRNRLLPRSLWFGRVFVLVVVVSSIGTSLLQILNATGLLYAPGLASYYFGVLWFIAYACVFFLRIVFVRPDG